MELVSFNRTLDQELQAVLRRVSLECLVCGEFLLHELGRVRCPECGATLRAAEESAGTQLQFDAQAG